MPFKLIAPVSICGSSISYFTGKLETYCRVEGIPDQLKALSAGRVTQLIREQTGSSQMPAMQLAVRRPPLSDWLCSPRLCTHG